MKMLAGLVAATVLLVGGDSAVLAQSVEETNARLDAVFGEHDTFAEVFDILYAAVESGDAATVASLAKYPLRVATNGEEYSINGEQTFVDNYDTLLTQTIVDTVLEQDYALLFVNQDGVMFGDGQVWLSPVCLDDTCETYVWLITAIQE